MKHLFYYDGWEWTVICIIGKAAAQALNFKDIHDWHRYGIHKKMTLCIRKKQMH